MQKAQDARERLEVRQRLHRLTQNMSRETNPEALIAGLTEANRGLSNITTIRELLADGAAMRTITEQAVLVAAEMDNVEDGVAHDTFIKGLIDIHHRTQAGGVSFASIGRAAQGLWLTAPPVRPLFGSLAAMEGPARVRNASQKRKREVGLVAVQPKTEGVEEEGDVREERQAEILKTLKSQKQAPFWQLVFDPTSFSNTLENMLDHSFLVKDGKASLNTKQNIVMTEITEDPALIKTIPASERKQAIFKIDYGIFNKLKGVIHESALAPPPSRRTDHSSIKQSKTQSQTEE
jgi:hypothetical protein